MRKEAEMPSQPSIYNLFDVSFDVTVYDAKNSIQYTEKAVIKSFKDVSNINHKSSRYTSCNCCDADVTIECIEVTHVDSTIENVEFQFESKRILKIENLSSKNSILSNAFLHDKILNLFEIDDSEGEEFDEDEDQECEDA